MSDVTKETTPWGGEGDKVAISFRYSHGRAVRMSRIERLTKTQIITTGGERFRRNDGREVGASGTWDRPDYLGRPDEPWVIDMLACQELAALMGRLKGCADGNRERIQVLKALRTMRHEIARTWATLGGDDTGPLED